MISKCLRGFIHAELGKRLIGGDYANVESRALAWSAGEEWKLQAYRDYDEGKGPDLYIVAAAKIYNTAITAYTKASPEREIGKRSELAFGYAGGKGAWRKFESFATKDYVPFSDEKIDEIKIAWRNTNPKIKQYWKDLQNVSINAVAEPGAVFTVGAPGRQSYFRKRGSFLWCRLPSSRVICYPYPDLRLDDYGQYLTFKGVPDALAWAVYAKAKEEKKLEEYKGSIVDDPSNVREWCRMKLHGGVLAGNLTPAICRDLLVNAMMLAEDEGLPVVLHVHDELVAEGKFTEQDRIKFEKIMSQVPAWATGFPVKAGCWLSERYIKG
jgi:DNA polymerase